MVAKKLLCGRGDFSGRDQKVDCGHKMDQRNETLRESSPWLSALNECVIQFEWSTLFLWQHTVMVFDAEVREIAYFSATRTDSERHGDTGNNLKSAFEVVSPANSRDQQKVAGPLGGLRRNHLLAAVENRLEQYVEARTS